MISLHALSSTLPHFLKIITNILLYFLYVHCSIIIEAIYILLSFLVQNLTQFEGFKIKKNIGMRLISKKAE